MPRPLFHSFHALLELLDLGFENPVSLKQSLVFALLIGDLPES